MLWRSREAFRERCLRVGGHTEQWILWAAVYTRPFPQGQGTLPSSLGSRVSARDRPNPAGGSETRPPQTPENPRWRQFLPGSASMRDRLLASSVAEAHPGPKRPPDASDDRFDSPSTFPLCIRRPAVGPAPADLPAARTPYRKPCLSGGDVSRALDDNRDTIPYKASSP